MKPVRPSLIEAGAIDSASIGMVTGLTAGTATPAAVWLAHTLGGNRLRLLVFSDCKVVRH